MWTEASAPSNIALIKYMGKTDPVNNEPCNSSLSWTLENLRTFVRIKADSSLKTSQWRPFERQDLRKIELSAKGTEKFLKHVDFLRQEFSINENFVIESANNFPSDCGLASSASSFAALTVAVYNWALANQKTKERSMAQLAMLSKKGSGSSCRSLFSPWAVWSKESVFSVELPVTKLKHMVVLCDENVKAVSSSEAHKRVLTSDLFKGRPERAQDRLEKLMTSLKSGNWNEAVQICWDEFWDMHLLFHTSQPGFMYMNGSSQEVLRELLSSWQKIGDSPIITMDAGSNIHLLFRPDQTELYSTMIKTFKTRYALWTDEGYLGNG